MSHWSGEVSLMIWPAEVAVLRVLLSVTVTQSWAAAGTHTASRNTVGKQCDLARGLKAFNIFPLTLLPGFLEFLISNFKQIIHHKKVHQCCDIKSFHVLIEFQHYFGTIVEFNSNAIICMHPQCNWPYLLWFGTHVCKFEQATCFDLIRFCTLLR